MNGFFGAAGQAMCSDLDVLVSSNETFARSFHFERTSEPGTEANSANVRIYCEDRLVGQSSDETRTLVLDGHILGTALNHSKHPQDVLEMTSNSGLASLKDVDGFYTLAVIDDQSATISLLRDQWGTQTIYYIKDERGVAFSTSLLELIPLLSAPVRPNLYSAEQFLLHGKSPRETETFFTDIAQVPPRMSATIEFSGTPNIQFECFHSYLALSDKDSEISFDDAVVEARKLLAESVESNLQHANNPAFTLSGGIDSSVGVMMARTLRPEAEIDTYSYVTNIRKSIDEERFVDAVNAHAGTSEHKLRMEAEDFFHYLPIAVRGIGTPLVGASQLAQFILYQMAAENNVDAIINGVEADSAFCGHAYFLVDRLLELLARGDIVGAVRLLKGIATTSTNLQFRIIILNAVQRMPKVLQKPMMAIIQPMRIRSWLGFDPPEAPPLALSSVAPSGKRRLQAHMRYQLSHDRLLRYAELCGAAASIYSRTPFLYRKLNEFILRLPSAYLISPSGETKQFLRAVVDGLIPDDVLNRRDKIGFEPPTKEWLSSNVDRVRAYIEDGVVMGIIAADHKILEKPNYATITRAISYVEWAKCFSVRFKG
jgi:asparagine synthase (glutamine-hydrolysing)